MGDNTISTVLAGDVASEEKWNQYKTALTGDLYPRNNSGKVTDEAGSLGSSSYRWDKAHFKTLDILSMGDSNNSVSSSSGNYSHSGVYADVTNLSVTITTTGRPVVVMLIPDGSANYSYCGSNGSGFYKILRDSTAIYESVSNDAVYFPCSAIMAFDIVAQGTYTYKIQSSSSSTVYTQYCKLLAYEI